MEKVDVKKRFPEWKGDFQPITEDFAIGGWGLAQTKKGAIEIVTLVRTRDNLAVTVFADQLRLDGDKLLVSKQHFDKQLARAATWAQGAPQTKVG